MSPATGPQVQICDPVDGLLPPSGAAVRSSADDPAPRGLEVCDPRLSALGTAVAALARDYGRSPARPTSWRLGDNCVVTAHEDFMTIEEQELVESGGARLVRQLRSAFAEVVGDEYARAAEDALGRDVIARRSELICASNICFEIFVPAKEPRRRGLSPLGLRVPDSQHSQG